MNGNTSIIENQNIVDYYDNCQVDYSIVWHLNTHLSLHYGFWDETTKRLRHALIKMNDVLAEKIEIKSSDRVLDAGCGVGGSSMYLAKKYNIVDKPNVRSSHTQITIRGRLPGTTIILKALK